MGGAFWRPAAQGFRLRVQQFRGFGGFCSTAEEIILGTGSVTFNPFGYIESYPRKQKANLLLARVFST